MKKLLSLVLALCMVLMVGAVFAEPSANAKDVKVTGLDKGDEVSFYQVVEWVGETADDSDVTGWKAISPFDTVLTKTELTKVLLGTEVANSNPVKYENPTGITTTLANALSKKATATVTPITANDDGEATLTKAEPGIYMALVKPVKVDTVYNPIFVSVDFVNGANNQEASTYADSTAKKSTLTLTKTAANANDYNGDNGQTAAVDDIITYTVKATIPAYGAVYTNPYFAIKDTLTDLELQTSTIAVSGGPTSSDYDVNATTSGYTITFKPAYLQTIKSATEVTVTYQAKVTTAAKKIINEETNDVWIEYSHDPSNENDHDVKKDTTQHYTFSIDAEGLSGYTTLEGERGSEVVKIGLDANGNPINSTTEYSKITKTNSWTGPLDGAVFGLWKKSDCKEGEEFKTATTDGTGRMNFAGLDAGTYYLKEISAPAGFVTNSDIHTIVLAATVDTVKVTEYWDGTKWVSENTTGTYKSATYETEILKSYSVKIDGNDVSTYTFTNASTSNSNEIKWTTLDPVELPCQLVNTKGTELPHTGGIGTTIFYIVGGILLVGAAVILVARRKAQD